MYILSEISPMEIGVTAVCLLYVITKILDKLPKSKDKVETVKINDPTLNIKIDQLVTKLQEQNVNETNFRRDFYEMKSQTSDLHDWHNKDDEDGGKIWYVKSSLEKSISENSETNRAMIRSIDSLRQTIIDLDS